MHSLQVQQKKAKHSPGLAQAVKSNTQSSKKCGSHVMKSKTKHFQKERKKKKKQANLSPENF